MFFYGMITGIGLLALAQNLFDYRIDEFVIEKVYKPAKKFVLHLFGKK